MRDLRIVFLGTPDFAVGILKKLVAEQKNIVGVITAPDRPAGRGRKLMGSAVKEYAVSQNLPVLQPTNLKNEDFLNELKALNANLQIIVAFRMLPKVVWALPEYGTFNLHASILPQYRGAAPINWAIINGEAETGVTTFFIDEKIDTGAIIATSKTVLSERETVGTLHDTLMELGSDLVVQTVAMIEADTVTTTIQETTEPLKDAPKLTPDNTKIDWNESAATIDALVRGLSPYPVAWCYLENEEAPVKVKIYNTTFEIESHSNEIGTLLASKKELKVAVKDGYIVIHEMQLPGKRKMEISALLNGYSFNEEAKVL